MFFNVDDFFLFLGYTYKYPFLSSTCGIQVENNVIKHLFKHMINIEYPTMGFIGVPRNTTGFYLFDLQVILSSYVHVITDYKLCINVFI